MTTWVSTWRCDDCGETFSIALTPISGREVVYDLRVVKPIPCGICGGPMRRVEGPGDLRDWGAPLRATEDNQVTVSPFPVLLPEVTSRDANNVDRGWRREKALHLISNPRLLSRLLRRRIG